MAAAGGSAEAPLAEHREAGRAQGGVGGPCIGLLARAHHCWFSTSLDVAGSRPSWLATCANEGGIRPPGIDGATKGNLSIRARQWTTMKTMKIMSGVRMCSHDVNGWVPCMLERMSAMSV